MSSSDPAGSTSRARRPLTTAEIAAVCRRAFGADARVTDAIELGLGTYNTTYRLTLAGQERPVVLRVAPEESRQFLIERHFMRNEHATLPWLAPIAALLPSVLAADWTHDVIERDWMIQTWLDGLPAPDGLARYPRADWGPYFRELGAITKSVHAVHGPSFGPIVGPGFATWSDALLDCWPRSPTTSRASRRRRRIFAGSSSTPLRDARSSTRSASRACSPAICGRRTSC